MAWLLFMDESGHSHKELPYEVRGGFALADTHLWPFVQDALRLELSCFGARLADYKSEIKGMKLLSQDRFTHAQQMAEFEARKRQQLCRALLQAGLEKRPPTREQLTSYGQASPRMADGIFDLLSYEGLNSDYVHQAIDHAECYVKGNVHTNGLENFWCLLKRCFKGTYVSVEPFHLFRYLDEEVFRFNNPKDNDGGRYLKAVGGIAGRRLTYRQLIGPAPAT